MFNIEATGQPSILFGYNSRWLKICLFVMFLLAALIRRDEIKAPGHLIEREYNSAIFARAFYFEGNKNVELWRQNNAIAARDQLPLLEPPLTEYLVSLIYRIMDQEEIWYARYLTGIFWLIGGIFFFKSVKILTTIDAALFALGYYLFTPWGIIISRSFQPDSLMMMMFMISLYSIILYFENFSWNRLIAAGLVTGITLLLRPLVLFAIFGAFITLNIYKNNKWPKIINRQLIVFLFLSIFFPLFFYGYGIYVAGFLQGQAALSFRPYMLARWDFWTGWFNSSANVIGYPFLIMAVAGFLFLRHTLTRFLVLGLAIGYFIFGLFFTFHVYTHPYYHIQLFPIIAICIAPLLSFIVGTLKKQSAEYWWMPVILSLMITLYFSYRDVRDSLYTQTFEDPSLASEIGEIVGHSSRTVFVAIHYGLPLEYYGEFSGGPWPVRIDDPFYRRPDARELSVQERLDGLGFIPEYFVITNFDLYTRKHQDLKQYLETNCVPYVQSDNSLIYSNCQTGSDTDHYFYSINSQYASGKRLPIIR